MSGRSPRFSLVGQPREVIGHMVQTSNSESDGRGRGTDGESATRRRIDRLIDSILEDESLSSDTGAVLRYLRSSEEDLAEMDTEELSTQLLEGLQ